jgi:hypothetical protein
MDLFLIIGHHKVSWLSSNSNELCEWVAWQEPTLMYELLMRQGGKHTAEVFTNALRFCKWSTDIVWLWWHLFVYVSMYSVWHPLCSWARTLCFARLTVHGFGCFWRCENDPVQTWNYIIHHQCIGCIALSRFLLATHRRVYWGQISFDNSRQYSEVLHMQHVPLFSWLDCHEKW